MFDPISPTSIILRLPDDDDGNKIFAEILINTDGSLDNGFTPFGVDEDDSFNELSFSDLVLARKDSEDSSTSLAAFNIGNATLYEMMGQLDSLVPKLLDSYNNTSAGRTLQ